MPLKTQRRKNYGMYRYAIGNCILTKKRMRIKFFFLLWGIYSCRYHGGKNVPTTKDIKICNRNIFFEFKRIYKEQQQSS